jgi:hypothetical protein
MEESKKIPLARGLLGREIHSIYGQMEVSLINYDTVHIAIWRKPYSGLSDVEFSVSETDLKAIINILTEAKKKADTCWVERAALKTQSEAQTQTG